MIRGACFLGHLLQERAPLKMQKKLNNKGFTIVEVLIVLAIAGAILAGILLAVPALQRNSRNTQLKTAANDVVAAISDYTVNTMV